MNIFSKKKIVFALFFLLLNCTFLLIGQDAPLTEVPAAAQDETSIVLDSPPATDVNLNDQNAPVTNIWAFVRVILVLLFVCAAIYGTIFVLKKTTRINAANDPYIKNVATLSLSPNKSMRIITVGTQAFLVGITDQSISLISEIKDNELIDAMNLESDLNASAPPVNFASVLSSFLPKKARESSSASPQDSESALATTNFLRKQRERIQNGGKAE